MSNVTVHVVTLETVLVYDLPPTIGALGAIIAALVAARHGKRNAMKLREINNAVNGAGDAPTLQENVERLVDKVETVETAVTQDPTP